MDIGWQFPLTGGGNETYYKDPGIETFSGARFTSLAREIIQNSLDAKDSYCPDSPVKVDFTVTNMRTKQFPGHKELVQTFKKCLIQSKKNKDPEAITFCNHGLAILQKPTIKFLHIADYNTTGLQSEPHPDMWHRLTKAQGISGKDDAGAGGSFGIGKNAPYVVSGLRTVFYSTKCKTAQGRFEQKAQGRSVLLAHETSQGKAQHIGFYGKRHECQPIPRNDIQDFLLRKKQGTTVHVAGFKDTKGWNKDIAAAVVANFFVAINDDKLQVSIEGIEDINAKTLKSHFERLMDYDDINLSYQMYCALTEGEQRDFQLSKIGHCKIHILVKEGMRKKVGIIRKTGMMISSEVRGLKQFSELVEFVAVCICDNDKGNVLLRQMENPSHTDFQPDRLGDKAKDGHNALKELASKIREKLLEFAQPDKAEPTKVREMEEFFPDLDDDGTNSNEGPDRDFESGLTITRKPFKRGRFPSAPGPGGTSGTSEFRPVLIEKIRMLKGSEETKRTVKFTPTESVKASLIFQIAGDSESVPLELSDASAKKAKNFALKKGVRNTFPLEMKNVTNGAIRIVAQTKKRPSRKK